MRAHHAERTIGQRRSRLGLLINIVLSLSIGGTGSIDRVGARLYSAVVRSALPNDPPRCIPAPGFSLGGQLCFRDAVRTDDGRRKAS